MVLEVGSMCKLSTRPNNGHPTRYPPCRSLTLASHKIGQNGFDVLNASAKADQKIILYRERQVRKVLCETPEHYIRA